MGHSLHKGSLLAAVTRRHSLLNSTVLMTGNSLLALAGVVAVLTPQIAQAQDPTPLAQIDSIITFDEPPASGTGNGDSAPATVDQTFSPPTTLGVINWFLGGQQGGSATDNGQSGGNGGDGSQSLTLTIDSGVTVDGRITIANQGGFGGSAFYGYDSMPTGGNGGQAGTVTMALNGTVTISRLGFPVYGASIGGDGGAATDGGSGEYAANGGSGGDSQLVSVVQGGTITNQWGPGMTLSSNGGNGQKGGDDSSGIVQLLGGDGGSGGNAGPVNYTLTADGSISASGGWGVRLESIGGNGGDGGIAYRGGTAVGGSGGTGKDGGNAGAITARIDGWVNVTGTQDFYGQLNGLSTGIGVLAQSYGGAGGNGGNSEAPIGGGGGGGYAKDGGAISLTGGGVVTTAGASESGGILAQSIGGGGGVGGSVTNGQFAVGGAGGNGANGGSVQADIGIEISTVGLRSSAFAAQSIGGGGGTGGSVGGTGLIADYLIGGSGGLGGNGGTIDIASSSSITTSGAHSSGIFLQSIGGGGGNGGSAIGKTVSGFAGSAVSLGGSGGSGGDGNRVGLLTDANGNAVPTNRGTITTSGSDSFGIIGQSIGGGGGVGGNSAAEAKVYSVSSDPPLPTLSVALALGGTGGAGGSGGDVALANAGVIATTGAGGLGIVGQSIGGGGGSGGDSAAVATAKGSDEDSFSFSGTLSIGGNGGGSGVGGSVTLGNIGIIVTTGQAGDAMIAQSIGGGGGNGGSADGKATSSGDGTSIATTMSLGGQAASGGGSGIVTISNSGALITLGDGGAGMAAQSIGGGGGRGGGGAGTSNGDFSASINVGGNGGSGGSASQGVDSNGKAINSVVVLNEGSIATFGSDSVGIIAQSIGGGGGNGGKAATSLGSNKSTGDGGNGAAGSTTPTISALTNAFAAGGLEALKKYNSLAGLNSLANCLLGNASACNPGSGVATGVGDPAADADALNSTGATAGDSGDDSESDSITASINIGQGGNAGGGGDAGAISVTNTGSIGTIGKMSDGILAQAIGGGGGKGGASISSTTKTDVQGAISVGGQGGAGGDGAFVEIANSGSVITTGALAAGIVAQSIAGGGGIGGASGAKVKPDGSSKSSVLSVPISIGGNGGGAGTAGQAVVSISGAIITQSHDAIGIIAQSIAGGGGIVKTLSTDASDNNGGAANATGGDYGINLKFGGSGGANSNGGSGLVHVATTAGGTITTKGDNAYGILAQPIAGGGGLVLGGKPAGTSASDFFGTGTTSGSVIDDGKNDSTDPNANSGLFVNVGANISTGFAQKNGTVTGKGASAVIAQSIGGGGGLAGDTGWTQQHFGFGGGGTNRTGNGGVVEVTINSGVDIKAIGDNTTAIIAQSIGGGGGYIANTSGLFTGTAGGRGYGNDVTVTNDGTITVTGAYAIGIFAQSDGDGSQHGQIAINNHGTVNGSASNWAIYFDHGGTQDSNNNVLNNWGTINSGSADGYAVYGNAGYVYITNSGTIWGKIDLTDGGGSGYLDIIASGFVHSTLINVGNNCAATTCGVSNAGTLDMRSASGTARITGDYVGKPGSSLVLAADFAGGKGTQLTIDGDAVIEGMVDVRATSIRNRALTLITSTGTLKLGASLQSSGTHLFDYAITTDSKVLQVTPRAHFAERATTLGANEKAVAANLQSLFDGGASADAAFTRLLGVADDAGYAAGLGSLAGQGLGAFGAFRFNSSRTFAANLYGGCPELQLESRTAERCGWARLLVNDTTQKAGTDKLGYTADAWASQKGVQLPLNDDLAIIGSIAYESTKFRDGNGSARISGDSLVGGLGLLYTPAQWELSAGIDAAYGWYKSSWQIMLGLSEQAAAKPEQSQVGGHVRAAINLLDNGASFVRPFVEGHAIHVSNKAFTETGNSPFRLAVEAQSDTALIGVAGVELGTKLPLSTKVTLRPFASAAIEYGSPRDWTTTARFADQPNGDSFDLTTAGPGTLGRFSIGADLLGAKNVAFSVQYAPELGSGFTSHSGTARLTIAF
ncbi:autotransporter outer membrane beta-barrel domain-containing protein [Sandaracinobacteroides hominis]|uniref:autotransporter outer membrane beta-barrel domain-containing protein n=1 Tax=Sandaracinobacteroides hominis TaxID=2780086 RepID=UPI0018F53361|nr:autotransporter outer membrane beta-barrel domain-containing protein [Sandaracinobacteroides hominis]